MQGLLLFASWAQSDPSTLTSPSVLAVFKKGQLRGADAALGRGKVFSATLTHFFRSAGQLGASGVEGESGQRPIVGRNGAGRFL